MTIEEAKKKLEDLIINSPWPNTEEVKIEICELSMFIYEQTGIIGYMEEAYSTGLLTNMEYKLNEYLKAINRGEEIHTYEVADMYFSGKLGSPDYRKAFEYFSRAAVAEPVGDGKSLETSYKNVRFDAKYKLAIMYKNGLYINKSYDKYKELITEIYEQIKEEKWYEQRFDIKNEMAEILLNEGMEEKGLELLLESRGDLCLFVKNYGFYSEDLIKTNELIYRKMEFDYTDIRPEDVTYLLNKEGLMRFMYQDKPYRISVEIIDGRTMIRYEDKYYTDPVTFMEKAQVEEVPFCVALFDTYEWEVL